jgi:hypothetical protein
MLTFSCGLPDPSNPLLHLKAPFIKGSNLIHKAIVQPEDWEGFPDTVSRREVQDKV